MPEGNHKTVPVLVWADVDEGVADMVRYLNTISGVRTDASCQGTIGEGGEQPYRAQVMAHWTPEAEANILAEFDATVLGDGWGYLHPRAGWSAPTIHPSRDDAMMPPLWALGHMPLEWGPLPGVLAILAVRTPGAAALAACAHSPLSAIAEAERALEGAQPWLGPRGMFTDAQNIAAVKAQNAVTSALTALRAITAMTGAEHKAADPRNREDAAQPNGWRDRLNIPCTMGVGCDEAGVCFAAANGEPDRCPKL